MIVTSAPVVVAVLAVMVCAVLACIGLVWLVHRQRLVLARTRALVVRARRHSANLVRLKAASEQARLSAEAATRAQTLFFLSACHDLRQPLHALGLFADSLRRSCDDGFQSADLPGRPVRVDPDARGLVHSIVASIRALEVLFDELLDLSRIDSGALEVRARAFALSELYAGLRQNFEPVAFDRGLTLDFRGGQRAVCADPVLVERILRNLLANAIGCTHDGGVIVSARSRGDQVLLQVWDSGVGIAAEELPKVFDAFYRVVQPDQPDARRRLGMGLGLAIVERLAGLMHTSVGVRSEAGRGSVFSFCLPAAVPGWRGEARPAAGAGLTLTLQGRRIVVVEPDAAARQRLGGLLDGWGAQVLAFDDGRAVRHWACAAGRHPRPDLLIVEQGMSDGGGAELVEALRSVWGASLPAFMVADAGLPGDEVPSRVASLHLLVKPVAPNRLRALVSFHLGERPAAGSSTSPAYNRNP